MSAVAELWPGVRLVEEFEFVVDRSRPFHELLDDAGINYRFLRGSPEQFTRHHDDRVTSLSAGLFRLERPMRILDAVATLPRMVDPVGVLYFAMHVIRRKFPSPIVTLYGEPGNRAWQLMIKHDDGLDPTRVPNPDDLVYRNLYFSHCPPNVVIPKHTLCLALHRSP